MNFRKLVIAISCLQTLFLTAQHQVTMNATLDAALHTITIDQNIVYQNKSRDTLDHLVLLDWANSYTDKTTPLGKRFSEEFLKRFFYAKDIERGSTDIKVIQDDRNHMLTWQRFEEQADLIKITLPQPLAPGQSYTLQLAYTVKIPSEKFTRFGFYDNGDYHLKHWYITPAVYQEGWQTYSNKNLDDYFSAISDYSIEFELPDIYHVTTELTESELDSNIPNYKKILLTGNNRTELIIYLEQKNSFYNYQIGELELLSNIEDNDLSSEMKKVATTRIINYLKNNLGDYPYKKIIITKDDYKNNPVYGLNQLPDIVRPFPDGFQYEIKQLKAITENYLEKTLLINPRYDAWLKDGLHIYLMMGYTEKNYSKMKAIGNLSNIIGIRWFHLSDIEFNDQYFLLYKNMARLFLHQPLDLPQDELIKFNKNIANAYKAGVGLRYLETYLEAPNLLSNTIREFYDRNQFTITGSSQFQELLQEKTDKDVSWFFSDFVGSNSLIDFTFKSVKKKKDSLQITIKNTKENSMPVSITALKDKKPVFTTWVDSISNTRKVTIENKDYDKLVLDYDRVIPEVNRRNNYKNLKGLFNKPFQFRFFEDIEDPSRSQMFFIPEFEFDNIYDGFTIGAKFYNTTFIRRNFSYKITPSYGFGSKTLIGGGGITYRHFLADDGLYQIRYIVNGSKRSYNENLFAWRFSPSVTFFWRPKDLRSNVKENLSIRSVNVFRDEPGEEQLANLGDIINTPDYSVFNTRYLYSDFNLTNFTSYLIDYQIAKNFSKIAATINYRKLFLNNRSINLRFFAGAFLFNDTERDGDYFSFALDRPSDYLFDFNYIGRSEEEGLVSQQIIPAEGGFKSQLDTPFANQWIATANANTNIWNWIYAYGDIGLVKNKGNQPNFVYDAGIRLSLVQDYFELFFPVVSNNGWEISQPNYSEKIRFMITLSPKTLIGLFTREWY
ncbi:metalloprotease [Aquimarina sp. ERC-38]|uniref:metalloprotease n=1 Tax=Aquimarina sp. ERC-38 TaxID=2949996 RepID=UPI002247E0EB|nr:metalloprotease [Aquimarina sp. ERC-38]UZO79528.1 metalloprotease [Aquimarina sp. ERC-38]